MIKRLRDACRTNEPQRLAVLGMTLLNGLALLKGEREITPWVVIPVLAFWPVLAFTFNLLSPIPKASHDRQ